MLSPDFTCQRVILFHFIFANTFEDATINIPRIEQNLPVLREENLGKGKRHKLPVSKKLSGEDTTKVETESEQPCVADKKKHSVVQKSAEPSLLTTTFPLPPPSLRKCREVSVKSLDKQTASSGNSDVLGNLLK